MNIKFKLISLFIVLKVIPLIFIAFTAIEAAKHLGASFERDSNVVLAESNHIIKETADTAIHDSIKALDKKSQQSIEMLTLQIANNVASFLKKRDGDLLLLASLKPEQATYEKFFENKKSDITLHEPYIYDNEKNIWTSTTQRPYTTLVDERAELKDNSAEFNKRAVSKVEKISIPIYKEVTFYDLNGAEIIKVSSIDSQKHQISQKKNTFIKAEDYFEEAKNLKKGEIYVSDVIGAYVPSKIIGDFTKPKAEKLGIPFEPEDHGYAGVENPVGKKFDGIVRFVTPVYDGENKIGYVTLALDHAHLREYTDFIYPTENFISNIKDAKEGNYAFIWDYKGRNIVHPRDHSIVGYNPETGEQVPGWISENLAKRWKESGVADLNAFLKDVTPFEDQGWHQKPNSEQAKIGQVGLDCRYLNFAPQCQGWFQLVRDGGYGSFMIMWSGLYKLTTAAAIPYYTGHYGKSKVGFGFVAIGANVDEFHSAATQMQENIDSLLKEKNNDVTEIIEMSKKNTLDGVSNMIKEISLATLALTILVVIIAIFVANGITKKIFVLMEGAKEFSENRLDHEIKINTKDEFGKLAQSFNTMAKSISKLLDEQKELNSTLEERVKSEVAKNREKDHKIIQQSRLVAIGEMLGNVSHHWRQPLNMIEATAQDLREAYKFGELDDAYLENSVDQISQSTSYMSSVIDQFGHFFKPKDEISDFDVSILVQEALEVVSKTFEYSGIDLTHTVEDGIFVSGHLQEFRQVIANILTNAQEAVIRNKGEKKISVKLERKSGDMYLSVQDSGGGVETEILHKIFDPYFSTKFESQGTGIGLYMSKMIIENTMNGSINVSNRDNGFFVEIIIPEVGKR